MANPVTTHKYAHNETYVYNFLYQTMGYNTAVCCGILANVEAECDFNHTTTYANVAYGLFQMEGERRKGSSRIPGLEKWCAQNGLQYTSVEGQLKYMQYELSTTEKSTANKMKEMNVTGNTLEIARNTAYWWCKLYERARGGNSQGLSFQEANERESQRRKSYADKYWNNYYGNPEPTSSSNSTTPVSTVGFDIVEAARSVIDKPYEKDKSGPDSFDDKGLIMYAYKEGGKTLSSPPTIDNLSKNNSAKLVREEDIAKADLLFYRIGSTSDTTSDSETSGSTLLDTVGDTLSGWLSSFRRNNSSISSKVTKTNPEYRVALATGSGGKIEASSIKGKVIETDSIGSPDKIYRVISDQEAGLSVYSAYQGLTIYDPYIELVDKNLALVEEAGYDYGYLIDLTHDITYKFYIPDFSESAGASWSPVNIIGRSSAIYSYEHTDSRSIQINLDLYAGAGLYSNKDKSIEDIVGQLHSDVDFIKSLEYPDYSQSIVQPPATVQLILGPTINLVGIVSGVTVQHLKPLDTLNRSMYMKVQFTVTENIPNPKDYRDIYKTSGVKDAIQTVANTIAGTGSIGSAGVSGLTSGISVGGNNN